MTVHGCNYVGHCLATFIGKHNLIYTCIVPANDVVVVVGGVFACSSTYRGRGTCLFPGTEQTEEEQMSLCGTVSLIG